MVGLSCDLSDENEYTRYWDGEPEFLKDESNEHTCRSCKRKIPIKEMHYVFQDYKMDEDGEETDHDSVIMCNECGEICENLLALEYCICPDVPMAEYLKEYHELTGFEAKQK